MRDYLISDRDNASGLGGIYNSRNLQTYHYAGNNPLKYTDPTGRYAYYHMSKEMREEQDAFRRELLERYKSEDPEYLIKKGYEARQNLADGLGFMINLLSGTMTRVGAMGTIYKAIMTGGLSKWGVVGLVTGLSLFALSILNNRAIEDLKNHPGHPSNVAQREFLRGSLISLDQREELARKNIANAEATKEELLASENYDENSDEVQRQQSIINDNQQEIARIEEERTKINDALAEATP